MAEWTWTERSLSRPEYKVEYAVGSTGPHYGRCEVLSLHVVSSKQLHAWQEEVIAAVFKTRIDPLSDNMLLEAENVVDFCRCSRIESEPADVPRVCRWNERKVSIMTLTYLQELKASSFHQCPRESISFLTYLRDGTCGMDMVSLLVWKVERNKPASGDSVKILLFNGFIILHGKNADVRCSYVHREVPNREL